MLLLIVDNDQLAIRPWVGLLRDAGYRIELRSHADRALEVNLRNCACAIIDVMMPSPPEWGDEALGGMATGVVLARKLREFRNDLPIIFATNHANEVLMSMLRDFPAPSSYLRKNALRSDVWVSEIRRMAGKPDADYSGCA